MKNNSYFQVGDKYAGKTIQDIAREVAGAGGYIPRTDVLAGNAGISEKSALNKGQYLSYANDPGSGEYQFLQNTFGAPIGETDYQTKVATDRQNAAIAPAVNTLNSQKDPLKARYDDLISQIRGRRDTAVNQAGIDTSREYAKRGISTQSGVYDIALRNARMPVEQQYAQLETAASGEEQDKLMAISNAIANLQAGAGKDAIVQALQAITGNREQGNIDRQYQFNVDQANKAAVPPPTNVRDNYLALGEGQTLYDLLNGKSLYTAPKTYKPTTGGGGDDPLGLNG